MTTEITTSSENSCQRFRCPRCLRGWADCTCPIERAKIDVEIIYKARIAAFERERAEPTPIELVRVSVRLRSSTWATIKHRANAQGISPDEWIRRALRTHGPEPEPEPEEQNTEPRVVIRTRIAARDVRGLSRPPTPRALYRGAVDTGSSARDELGWRIDRAVRVISAIERAGAVAVGL